MRTRPSRLDNEREQRSPECLDDVGGDGGSALVCVRLPGQRDAVLRHICDYGFVRRTWQLEGLGGLSYGRVRALWVLRKGGKKRTLLGSTSALWLTIR